MTGGGGRVVQVAGGDTLHVPKAGELLADQLRRRIATREWRDGDQLPPEQELTVLLGVSRATLREAFRILESDGLASVRRGMYGGVVVRVPSPAGPARQLAVLLAYRGAGPMPLLAAVAAVEDAAESPGEASEVLGLVAEVLRQAAGLAAEYLRAAPPASTPERPLTPARLPTGGPATVTRGEPGASDGETR